MLAIHIEETPEEIIVSRCDCVIARWERGYEDGLADWLVEILSTLGHIVERD